MKPFFAHRAGRRRRLRGAFTLLEIMLAMAILSILAVTVYQFTDTTLQSAKFYAKTSQESAAWTGLRNLLTTQLDELPTGMQGALVGLQIKNKNGRSDALQLVCAPGNATLTPLSKGYYDVTLDVRESPRGSGNYALGMERSPHDDDDDDADDNAAKPNTAGGNVSSARASDWIKLMDGVNGLEIAYFDSRLNGWVDKWNDQNILPNLVRLRLSAGAAADQPPYEMVLRVPGGGIRRDALTFLPGPNALGQAQGQARGQGQGQGGQGVINPPPGVSSPNGGNGVRLNVPPSIGPRRIVAPPSGPAPVAY